MSQDGIVIVDSDRRYVYANPAAAEMMGQPAEQLRGQDFLASFQLQERPAVLEALPDRHGEAAPPFTSFLNGPGDGEREIVCSTYAIDIVAEPHSVVILRDATGPRAAIRSTVALAQTAAQMVGVGTLEEILAGLARPAVDGSRAPACGIVVVGDDHKLTAAGGHGFPAPSKSREAWTAADVTLDDLPGGDTLLSNNTVVLPDARFAFEASPVLNSFAASLTGLDWQGAVYVPLSWEDKLFGVLGVYLPAGMTGPSETELAFYTALAGQAAVAATNARLAASMERTRLARELHDSVSQALFSMTMHARAAQLSMAKAGVDENTPLSRSVAQLAGLTRDALAEMRALIFELRPEVLARRDWWPRCANREQR